MLRSIKNFTHYTDRELLGFLQEENEQAFNELFKRYYVPLCMKAYKLLLSWPRVEDIVQDVFVNLWIKAASLDTGGNIRAYLYATLRNKVLDELRSESTRFLYASSLERLNAFKGDPSCLDSLYLKETEAVINETIAGLSPQCREAFCLSRYEQLSYKEIATRMCISVNTVEKHVAKALRILRNKFQEHGKIAFFLLLAYPMQ